MPRAAQPEAPRRRCPRRRRGRIDRGRPQVRRARALQRRWSAAQRRPHTTKRDCPTAWAAGQAAGPGITSPRSRLGGTREPSNVMTAASATSPALSSERKFALGLGLTNECNLSCAFCYRDPTRVDRLSLEQVRSVMRSLPVRSVNLGTGENGMHPEFGALVNYLRGQPIKLTITSNGYSIAALDDVEV